MIDEFFARKKDVQPCKDFHTTCHVIAKEAFKMFLGVEPDIKWDGQQSPACSFFISRNPLSEFVVLPPKY